MLFSDGSIDLFSGALALVLGIITVLNRMRPIASAQNQQTRELSSTRKISRK